MRLHPLLVRIRLKTQDDAPLGLRVLAPHPLAAEETPKTETGWVRLGGRAL